MTRIGLSDNWLRHVQDVRRKHAAHAWKAAPRATDAHDRLCELNVIEQVVNVCQTTIVQDAWDRGQEIAVHGWVYGLRDGILRDLNVTTTAAGEILAAYEAGLGALWRQAGHVTCDDHLQK